MSKDNVVLNQENIKAAILEKLNNSRDIVDRFLGYKTRRIPPIIDKKIKEEMKTIEDYLDIEMEYKIFQEDDKYSSFIIYTLGNKIEYLINSYTENTETIRALIIDKLSIVTLDCLKEYIIEEIEKKTDLYVIKEIYPGNKNFSLENQKKILESMDRIENISINKYYQLFPIKSVALKLELSKNVKIYSRCKDCIKPCEIQKNNL